MNQYKEEVVDPGDEVSKLAHQVNVASYRNNGAIHVVPDTPGNFRGQVGFVWQPHILEMMSQYDPATGEWVMKEVPHCDGAGGKPQFFTLVGTEEVMDGLGWEVIVMNADDLARWGGLPVVMSNEISFKRLTKQNLRLARAAVRGYGRALVAAQLVSMTGETAVMKHSITAFCDIKSDAQLVMTWGGGCLGLAHRQLRIDGSTIEPGMSIVGFCERGYRCNGGTAHTEIILFHWGPEPEAVLRSPEALLYAHELTVPSLSYARVVTYLAGWRLNGRVGQPLARIHGIAHITGGGVWNKLREILPQGVGAELHAMPTPPPILLRAQELSQVMPHPITDHQCYGTFHGGCGMFLVCNPADAMTIIQAATAHGIEAHIVGRTVQSDEREINIISRFREKGKELSSGSPE